MPYERKAIYKCDECGKLFKCKGLDLECNYTSCTCNDCHYGFSCNTIFLTAKEAVAYVL